MKTSREHVLDYIRAHQGVSAAELSRALQMTEANARYHLNTLATQGLVSVIGYRPLQGKGRPVRLFGLSELAIGNHFGALVDALLTILLDHTTDEARDQKLAGLANQLISEGYNEAPAQVERAGQFTIHSPHLAQRLFQSVRRLNEFHYEARWEAHAIAPRLILGRCPYAVLIDEHPELCQMDRYLIEQLTGVAAEQITKRQPDRRGIRQCVFALKKPATANRKTQEDV